MHGVPRNRPAPTAAESAAVSAKVAKYLAATKVFFDNKEIFESSERITDKQLSLDMDVTAKLIAVNPDFYTLWNYRKQIVTLSMKADDAPAHTAALCQAELALSETAIRKNPKCYAAWYHRIWVINHDTTDLAAELTLCNRFLDVDSRNFHCWNYRRYVAAKAQTALSDEMSFTANKIAQNFSNFSAWHYRANIIRQQYAAAGAVPRDVIRDEFDLVRNCFIDPYDQSGWLYHRWLCARVLDWAPPIHNAGITLAIGQRTMGDDVFTADDKSARVQLTNEQIRAARQAQFDRFVLELAMCQELMQTDSACKYVILQTALMSALVDAVRRTQVVCTAEQQSVVGDDINGNMQRLIDSLRDIDPPRQEYYRQLQQQLRSLDADK